MESDPRTISMDIGRGPDFAEMVYLNTELAPLLAGYMFVCIRVVKS
jgi:hypothetical protein